MSFVFTRVDDRAIHGQTVTTWSKIFQNNGILLVDDEISNDPTMRQIYKNAAVGMKVYIYTVEQALIKAKQASESERNYILIARSPIVFEKLEKGDVYKRQTYMRMDMAELGSLNSTYDLVYSSLAFHYAEDFPALVHDIYKLLRPGGILLFSQEHPIITATYDGKGHYNHDEHGDRCV